MRTHAFSVPLSLVYLARRVSLEEACDVGAARGGSIEPYRATGTALPAYTLLENNSNVSVSHRRLRLSRWIPDCLTNYVSCTCDIAWSGNIGSPRVALCVSLVGAGKTGGIPALPVLTYLIVELNDKAKP